eukprot:1353901-Rhodomonas_salina.4
MDLVSLNRISEAPDSDMPCPIGTKWEKRFRGMCERRSLRWNRLRKMACERPLPSAISGPS